MENTMSENTGSTETATQFTVEVPGGEQAVTLETLGDFDVSQVEEFRRTTSLKVPEGIIEFRIMEHLLEELEWFDKKKDMSVVSPVVRLEVEVIGVRNLKDKTIEHETAIGMGLRDLSFITNLVEDVGQVKAFLADIGMQADGKFSDLLDQSVGMEFVCVVWHKKDSTDTAKSYANIDKRTVEQLAAGETEAATAEVAQVAPPASAPIKINLTG